jgi:transcription antitermination factor NusG
LKYGAAKEMVCTVYQTKVEKKIDSQLKKKGVECWCPLQKLEKQWSDRKKIIEEPLFRSYVFVHIVYVIDAVQLSCFHVVV